MYWFAEFWVIELNNGENGREKLGQKYMYYIFNLSWLILNSTSRESALQRSKIEAEYISCTEVAINWRCFPVTGHPALIRISTRTHWRIDSHSYVQNKYLLIALLSSPRHTVLVVCIIEFRKRNSISNNLWGINVRQGIFLKVYFA